MKPLTKDDADNYINKVKEETNYYTQLWDSLTLEECLSMRKSNRFSRELIRHFKIYIAFRRIREALPIIAIGIVGGVIIDMVTKCLKQK